MTSVLCRLADIADGGARLVVVEGREIALFRVGEEVFALANACPHYGGKLAEGRISAERREVACPWHRFRFDLATGACVAAHGRPAARRYKVERKGAEIHLALGDGT